jgi:hypothetical protein
MTNEARDKALHERDVMFRRWRASHDEEKAALLRSAWGSEFEELLCALDRLTLDNGDELVDLVKHQGWHAANVHTRYCVIREIDLRIAEIRESRGEPPFDSSMPFTDEPMTLFETVRAYLFDDEGNAAPASLDPSCGDNKDLQR